MSELDDLREAVEAHRTQIEQANAALNAAIMRAYRAEREDGRPAVTLREIGEALGVGRQRAHQLVREIAAQQGRSAEHSAKA